MLHAELATAPGVVSVWDGPAAEATHDAASTMKRALLAALHRAADAGRAAPCSTPSAPRPSST